MFDYSLMFIQDHHVYDLLCKLPPKCNTTPDNIPSIVLKKCAGSLASPIAKIFRRSFFVGNVPEAWKRSLIVPLFKAGDSAKPTNYRPICLTSSISKIAEKILLQDISGYIKTIEAIPHSQHGFQDKKSVASLLVETLDHWTGCRVDSALPNCAPENCAPEY
jgi:hypothetical protein